MKTQNPFLTLLILCSIKLIGQNCPCEAALRQDFMNVDLNERTFYHYLNILDESTYDEVNNSGGFGFEIPIKNVPIGFDFDYDDYSNWRHNKLSKQEFTHTSESSLNILRKYVSDRGYESFDNCIDICNGIPGLYVTVVDSDEENIILEIFYYAPPPTDGEGAIKPVIVSKSLITNGTNEETSKAELYNKNEKIPPLSKVTKIITRTDKSKPTEGFVNVNGFTANFKINPYKKPIFPKIELSEKTISATDYKSSLNICNNCHGIYGNGVITNNSDANQINKAVYEVNFDFPGTYKIEIEHTAAQSRPIELFINNKLINDKACKEVTGGWHINTLKKHIQGKVKVKAGKNEIILYRNGVFPHISRIRFIPI